MRLGPLSNDEISEIVLSAKDNLISELKTLDVTDVPNMWWKGIDIKESDLNDSDRC